MVARGRRLLVVALLGVASLCVAGPRVVMISGAREYRSAESLKLLAGHLETVLAADCTVLETTDKAAQIPGIEAVADADVLVVFSRRLQLAPDQLTVIKEWCAVGRPLIENLLLQVSDFAMAHPGVAEIDLNPVIARTGDYDLVDARTILAPN